MDERSEAAEMDGEEAVHFCKPPTEEEVESWRHYWRGKYAEEHPRQPSPPMVNVGLALDLTGDGIREYTFRGTVYRLKPTPYRSGLALCRAQEQLEFLAAIGSLTGQSELVALHHCYATIANLGGELIVPPPPVNPFLEEGQQEDLLPLLAFLVQTGDETPAPDEVEGVPRRWNAAYYLMAYESVFGPPTTWQRFCAGMSCLRRLEAERAIQMHGAVLNAIGAAFGGEEQRQEWLKAQRQDAR